MSNAVIWTAWEAYLEAGVVETDLPLNSLVDQSASDQLLLTEHVKRPTARNANINHLVAVDMSQQKKMSVQDLAAPMRQIKSMSLAPASSSSSLLMVSRSGDLFSADLGEDTASKSVIAPFKIELPTSRQSRLFDDIFGSSSTSVQQQIQAAPRNQSSTSSSSLDVLNSAAHLLPPVSLLWKDLIPLPSKLPTPAVAVGEEARADVTMDGQDVEMEQAVKKPALAKTPAGLIAGLLSGIH